MYYKNVILDFDGTIARLFYNFDLSKTKIAIHNCMEKYGVFFPLDSDIFDSFSLMQNATLDAFEKEKFYKEVHDLVVKAEIDAIPSAIIIDGFFDFIQFLGKAKASVGIVTNNSEECIRAFLSKYNIKDTIRVIGRNYLHPEQMKPQPDMLLKMCNEVLSASPDETVYVGDNYRDYVCAISSGIDFIALTPTRGKYERFISKQPDTKFAFDYYQLMKIIGGNSDEVLSH